MKLQNIEFPLSQFAAEMGKLKAEKHFDYLITIVGEDFGEEGLGCIYILENTQTHERISVKALADKVDCYIPSVSHIWRIADFLEREVYDFLGIKFTGHPDMRRLYMRQDFKGHPLRKDFDMSPEANPYTLEDDVEPNLTTEYYLDEKGRLKEKTRPLFGSNDYVINIGPQHPATHGVLRLQTVLDGETIKGIYPHLGYIHRGIEKISEGYTYPQTLALTDRLDYLSASIQRHALVGVIEEAMGIELSDRIQYIRTIMDELQRLASHLLYFGCLAQDLGGLTVFLYGIRDREYVLNVMEETSGGRLIQNYNRIGGVQADIDVNFARDVKNLCAYLKTKWSQYEDVFTSNVIVKKRLQNVSVLTREDVIDFGCTGGTGRGAGWSNDVRKNHPYALYNNVEFDVPLFNSGDAYDRYLVRMEEMKQSVRIIEQLIDNIPAGEFYIKQKPIIKVPEGQWYFSTEGSHGEAGVYLDSRGDKSPYRLKFRPMGLPLVAALDTALKGEKLADLIAAGASMDYIIPDIDR